MKPWLACALRREHSCLPVHRRCNTCVQTPSKATSHLMQVPPWGRGDAALALHHAGLPALP